MTFPNGETVTRLRGDRVDDGYGGTRTDWDDPDELDIEGCGIAPRQGEELRERGREGVTYPWTLYCPYNADITYGDRIRTTAGTFEVEGPPGPWRNPFTGREAGATVHMSRTDG